ncbi:histidine triad nucleotide-binding protein [soil metagenome]
MTECVFCHIAAGKLETELLHEDEEVVAFRDMDPQAPAHILLIPRRHIPTVNDLSDGDVELIGKLVLIARRLAHDQGLAEDGYRLVLNCNRGAGQSVFHLHLHLLGGRRMKWPPG